jgi:hypothetical protein
MRYAGRAPGSSLLVCVLCGESCELPADVDADVCVNCGLQIVDEVTKRYFDAAFFSSVGIHTQD